MAARPAPPPRRRGSHDLHIPTGRPGLLPGRPGRARSHPGVQGRPHLAALAVRVRRPAAAGRSPRVVPAGALAVPAGAAGALGGGAAGGLPDRPVRGARQPAGPRPPRMSPVRGGAEHPRRAVPDRTELAGVRDGGRDARRFPLRRPLAVRLLPPQAGRSGRRRPQGAARRDRQLPAGAGRTGLGRRLTGLPSGGRVFHEGGPVVVIGAVRPSPGRWSMVLVWRGIGFLAPVVLIAGGLVGFFLCQAANVPDTATFWGGIVGVVLGGAAVWLVGRRLNRDASPKPHSLYWIPMEYWGPILALIGVIIFVGIGNENNSRPTFEPVPAPVQNR